MSSSYSATIADLLNQAQMGRLIMSRGPNRRKWRYSCGGKVHGANKRERETIDRMVKDGRLRPKQVNDASGWVYVYLVPGPKGKAFLEERAERVKAYHAAVAAKKTGNVTVIDFSKPSVRRAHDAFVRKEKKR